MLSWSCVFWMVVCWCWFVVGCSGCCIMVCVLGFCVLWWVVFCLGLCWLCVVWGSGVVGFWFVYWCCCWFLVDVVCCCSWFGWRCLILVVGFGLLGVVVWCWKICVGRLERRLVGLWWWVFVVLSWFDCLEMWGWLFRLLKIVLVFWWLGGWSIWWLVWFGFVGFWCGWLLCGMWYFLVGFWYISLGVCVWCVCFVVCCRMCVVYVGGWVGCCVFLLVMVVVVFCWWLGSVLFCGRFMVGFVWSGWLLLYLFWFVVVCGWFFVVNWCCYWWLLGCVV